MQFLIAIFLFASFEFLSIHYLNIDTIAPFQFLDCRIFAFHQDLNLEIMNNFHYEDEHKEILEILNYLIQFLELYHPVLVH